MPGLNIYKFIHRTIRGQLSQLLIDAGKTTYHKLDSVSSLYDSTLKLASFLANHAQREDQFVHPVLKDKLFPDLQVVENEHRATDEKLKEVISQISKIKEDVTAGRLTDDVNDSNGYEFYLTFADFQASYLMHMSHEERKIMPFLWSNSTPDKVVAILMGMQSTVTSQEVLDTIPTMYPYLNLEEAVKLTNMLKAENNFPAMIAEIKKSLSSKQCEEIFIHAGLAEEYTTSSVAEIEADKARMFASQAQAISKKRGM